MFRHREFCSSSSDESGSDQELHQDFIRQSISYRVDPLPSLESIRLSLSHQFNIPEDPRDSTSSEDFQVTVSPPSPLKKYQMPQVTRAFTQSLVHKRTRTSSVSFVENPNNNSGNPFKIAQDYLVSPLEVPPRLGTPHFGESAEKLDMMKPLSPGPTTPLPRDQLQSFSAIRSGDSFSRDCFSFIADDTIVLVAKKLESSKFCVVFAESEHHLSAKKYIGQMTPAEQGFLLCDIAQEMFIKQQFPNQLAYFEFGPFHEYGRVVLPEVCARAEHKQFPLSGRSKRLYDETCCDVYVLTPRLDSSCQVCTFETYGGDIRARITATAPDVHQVECAWPFSVLQAFALALAKLLRQ